MTLGKLLAELRGELEEAAKRWQDLPADVFIKISSSRGGFVVEFTAADGSSEASLTGSVECEPADSECGDVYEVTVSEAPRGWGPLLYDVAMEHAHPRGLIADRFEVTRAARKLWGVYFRKRSDVTKRELGPDCEAGTWDEALNHAYYKAPKIVPAAKAAGKLIE